MSDARSFTLTPVPIPRKRRLRGGRAILIGLGVLLVLVVVAQFALPPIAEKVVRESLEPPDRGVSVSLSSFPSVALLFGHADSATVHIEEARPGGRGGLEKLLARASHVNDLTSTVGKMFIGPLELLHVIFTKKGAAVAAEAEVTRHAIEQILPGSVHVSATDISEGLRLTLSTSVLGHTVSFPAKLATTNGALEVAPDLPVFDAVRIPVFDDPSVAVTSAAVHTGTSGAYVFIVDGMYT